VLQCNTCNTQIEKPHPGVGPVIDPPTALEIPKTVLTRVSEDFHGRYEKTRVLCSQRIDDDTETDSIQFRTRPRVDCYNSNNREDEKT
jgi:hypothetical protein